MSEAVLDQAIEHIADGLSVDWTVIDRATPAREKEWAKSLRVLSDIVGLHRAAAVDYEQTTLANLVAADSASGVASETWGKYRLATKVGEGSYGAVYQAWDSDLERDVAIKILHRRVGDTRLKQLLLDEGRALAKIRHTNVVNVLGVEAHGDRVGLCMEFVQGKTLADVVRLQGKLSAREAVLIGEDLCRALSAVHRAGYFHRDVKAKNVMRDDTGRIVLMDFGTGRTAEQQVSKNDRAGTPLYMAPEVIDGAPASPCSDVYSLGVLLYHLVTAEYPVDARSIEQLRDAHAQRRHRWLSERRPDLPVAFMQVIERAIALDPEERYQNASELLAALSELKTGTHPIVIRVVRWALVVAVFVLGMAALGAMTSAIFNLAFQRSDFATETFWDYLVWGRRTSLPPFLILLIVLLGGTVLALFRRLLLAAIPVARKWESAFRTRGRAIAHTLRLDEVSVLGSWALLLSVAVAAAALWQFHSLVLAVLKLPVATDSELALLSQGSVALHNQYRWVFSFVVMFSVAVWYPVARLVRKGQSLHWGLMAGGAVVTCVALALLHFPYRLLYFNSLFPFEAATWNNSRCYIIGERSDDRLLFCPEFAPPRNRTVKVGDPALTPLGVRESPFSRYQHVGDGSRPVTK